MNNSPFSPLEPNKTPAYEIVRPSKFKVSDQVVLHRSNLKSKRKMFVLATPQDHKNLTKQDLAAYQFASEGKKVCCSWMTNTKRHTDFFYDEELILQDEAK